MKQIVWQNPNKMRFESLHKTFNRSVKCVSTGNVISGTQISFYIRPFSQKICNGRKFSPGHLQKWDLDFFPVLPQEIRNYIEGKDTEFILYHFFYYKSRRRINIGWVLTDRNYRLVMQKPARQTEKTLSVMREILKYITE